MKKLLLFISVLVLSPFYSYICQADVTRGYDYPFVNAYEATVIGTPKIYAPKITEGMRQKELSLTILATGKSQRFSGT
jgi:hypothetical protein